MGDLLIQLHQLNRITSDVADDAQAQFAAFCASVKTVLKDWFTHFSWDEDLCKFYVNLLACDDRFKELDSGEIVMVLSHGSAAVEGGFPSTKNC